jgi:hypothetical protein
MDETVEENRYSRRDGRRQPVCKLVQADPTTARM